METIDKKVKQVFESEKERLEEQRDFNILLESLQGLTLGIENNFIIPQKDTIGKSIYFNVPKY